VPDIMRGLTCADERSKGQRTLHAIYVHLVGSGRLDSNQRPSPWPRQVSCTRAVANRLVARNIASGGQFLAVGDHVPRIPPELDDLCVTTFVVGTPVGRAESASI
jgi:hypothetical protein